MNGSLTTLALLCSLLLPDAIAQQTSADAPQTQSFARDFQAAVEAYDAGQFHQAAVRLEKLVVQSPKSFEVQELLGLCYGAQSQDARAIEHLLAAVHLKPDSVPARNNLATGLFHAGRQEDALAQSRKALLISPQDYEANHTLAAYSISQNRFADALPFLEAAQRARPAAYDNGYNLALVYLLTGRLEEARSLITALLAQKDTGELHSLLGRLDEKEGKYLAAADDFGIASHLDPSEDNLFVWATELLLHRTYQPAITVFKTGTQHFPQSPRLWIGLGMALYSRGEYQEAIQSLLTAADLNPQDPRCYLFLSKAYLSSPSQADAVIERFRKYAELAPDNARAQYYYAIALWKGRRITDPVVDYKRVEGLLLKSIALDGTFPDAHLQLGILYNDQHLYPQALPEYQKALELDPNMADAHFRLGRYYLHAGDKARADAEFAVFQRLQSQHQAEIDKERAEVQQFVVANQGAPSATP